MLGTNIMAACALNFHVVTLTFDGMLLGQVAVSEGIHDANGKLFLQAYAEQAGSKVAGMKDSHGNVSLGGTGVLGDALAGMVKERLGGRVRADTFGFLQRGFPADTSDVDAREAAMVGATAVLAAVGGEHESGSIAIRRTSGPGEPYTSEGWVTPLNTVNPLSSNECTK